MALVRELKEISRSFGPDAARGKLDLLERIGGARLSARDLVALSDTLCFLRAYPDSPRVLRAVEAVAETLRDRVDSDHPALLDSGVPGSANSYPYSYGVLQRMVRILPGCLEVDWNEMEDHRTLHHALVLVLTVGEHQGLDDTSMSMPEWVERCKSGPHQTDLEFLLKLFERDHLSMEEQAYLFESCEIPVRYTLEEPGTGRCEMYHAVERIHYQRRPVDRTKFPLRPVIRRPFTKLRQGKGSLIDLALKALCCRNLEIAPLIYAYDRDVLLADCGKGLQIALAGVLPDYRDAMESAFFFLVMKNGVPIAYGPASISFGCCEMGINLFPEFRGGEIRHIYAQFMRLLHHVLGVQYFFLTRYGMGEHNPEAIRSGAFWFYRQLGFVPTNPEVEALARSEERKRASNPAHRSDRRTLRRLSHTEAFFDLSRGAVRPVDLGGMGVRQSRLIEERYGGDRPLAERRLASRMARALGIADLRAWDAHARRALRIFAPFLALGRDPAGWSARSRAAMVRIIQAKGSRSERKVDRMLCAHRDFRVSAGAFPSDKP